MCGEGYGVSAQGPADWLLAVCLGAALALTMFIYRPTPNWPRATDFAKPKEIACLAIAAATFAGLLGVRRRSQLDRVDSLLAGAVSLTILSICWATNKQFALESAGVTAAAGVLFLAARQLPKKLNSYVQLSAAVIAMTAAIIAILEGLELIPRVSQLGRGPGGTMGNRNYLSHLLVVAIPVTAMSLLVSRARWRIVLSWLASCVLVFAIIASRSRASWIALTIAVVTIVIASVVVRGPRQRILLFVLSVVLGAILASFMPTSHLWRSTTPYSDTLKDLFDQSTGSGKGRIIQYRTTLDIIADAPLQGVGAGNWPIAYAARAMPGDPSYRPLAVLPVGRLPLSDWLGIPAERGGIVLLLLMAAVLQLVRWLWSAAHSLDADVDARGAFVCGAGLSAAVFTVGAFDSVILTAAGASWIAVLVGLTRPHRAPVITRAFDVRLAAGFFALVSVVALLHSLRWMRSEQHLLRDLSPQAAAIVVRTDPNNYEARMILSFRLVSRGRCEEAAPHLHRALELFPTAPAPRELLGRCALQPLPGSSRQSTSRP